MSELKPRGSTSAAETPAAAPALPRPVIQTALALIPGARRGPELAGKSFCLELTQVSPGSHLEAVNLTRHPGASLGDPASFRLELFGLDEALRTARVLVSAEEARALGIRAGDCLRVRAANDRGQKSFPVEVVLAPEEPPRSSKRELGSSPDEPLPRPDAQDSFPTVAHDPSKPKLEPRVAASPGPATPHPGSPESSDGVVEWK